MAVAKWSDICRGALQLLGVVAAGEDLSGSDAELASEFGNGLLDQWAAERLAVFKSARTTFTITQTASFTVGTGGTVNVARPVYVDHVAYQDTSQTTPVEVPLVVLTEDGYAAYPAKTQTNTVPASYYYDNGFTSGLARVFLLPIPTSSTLQGVLYAPNQIARFAALTDTFSLPPGYERFIRTNLALELASPFEKEPAPWLVDAARESKGVVKRANLRPAILSVDPGALGHSVPGGRYDIHTDR